VAAIIPPGNLRPVPNARMCPFGPELIHLATWHSPFIDAQQIQ